MCPQVQYPSVEFVYKSDVKAIELVFRSIKWVRPLLDWRTDAQPYHGRTMHMDG